MTPSSPGHGAPDEKLLRSEMQLTQSAAYAAHDPKGGTVDRLGRFPEGFRAFAVEEHQ